MILPYSFKNSFSEFTEEYPHPFCAYEEMRTFRHDYKNILCTMEDYIDAGDIRSLKDFFHDEILPTSDALPGRDFVIGRLGAIHVRPIKSILHDRTRFNR